MNNQGLHGGFTLEDARKLHKNLVTAHISKALSGEKMPAQQRVDDLAWIHGVIVQAAWFVQSSIESAGGTVEGE